MPSLRLAAAALLAAALALTACDRRSERPPQTAVRVAPGPGEQQEIITMPADAPRPWESSPDVRRWVHYEVNILSGGVPPMAVTRVQEPNGKFTVYETVFPTLNDGSPEAQMVIQQWGVWISGDEADRHVAVLDRNPVTNRSYPEGSPHLAIVSTVGDPVRLYQRLPSGSIMAFAPNAGRDPVQGTQEAFAIAFLHGDPREVIGALRKQDGGDAATENAAADSVSLSVATSEGHAELEVAGWTEIDGSRWPTDLLLEVRDPQSGALLRRSDYRLVEPPPPLPY